MDAENVEVGFEEGKLRLPSHVLDDQECVTKAHMRKRQSQQHHRRKAPVEPLPQHLKSSTRPHHRPKVGPNGASGGSGMQAFFLESGRKSCGTGVFLPQRVGANSQASKKPACSPVLLPSRVVQALNLNVHALGLHIPPRKDTQGKPKVRDCNSSINKNVKELPAQCCIMSQNESSPEIFLPKEWTY
ncbi:uncharacterized protein LOC133852458 [Alnus glutinosa]|uniref:uncharacterized protein LOC133852458 n=1 Tax=Alnus glutinosa TaxID=3517 RepID=UPI002D77E05A|nr:uncharacterized protein LOC133852458 [Alnus glutinosa]